MPIERICCDKVAVLNKGDKLDVLWSDGVKYWSKFVVQGIFFILLLMRAPAKALKLIVRKSSDR